MLQVRDEFAIHIYVAKEHRRTGSSSDLLQQDPIPYPNISDTYTLNSGKPHASLTWGLNRLSQMFEPSPNWEQLAKDGSLYHQRLAELHADKELQPG